MMRRKAYSPSRFPIHSEFLEFPEFLSPFPHIPSSRQPSTLMQPFVRADQVQKREEENPHDVNEVPIQTGDFDRRVIRR